MSPKIEWTKITPSPDPQHGVPSSRSSHGLSILPNNSRLFLYGGEHIARTPLDTSQSLWSCDRTEEDNSWSWRNLSTVASGTPPPARVAHAQAIIAGRLYIFGGRAGITMNESPMNDLWALDVSHGVGHEVWAQIRPTTNSDPPPEPRSFHKMIAVGSDLYVFGGCGASGRLNDLHKFDTIKRTWSNLGNAHLLKGRGGPNLLHLKNGNCLVVVAGFVGEESKDGQRFDLPQAHHEHDEESTEKKGFHHTPGHHEGGGTWADSLLSGLDELRPRSVCVSASFPKDNIAILFGGEVNPSERGHEGAGGFENDVVVLDGTTGAVMETVKGVKGEKEGEDWPASRGWSDGDAIAGDDDGSLFYVFGGLTGDDKNPVRLDDLWCCNIKV